MIKLCNQDTLIEQSPIMHFFITIFSLKATDTHCAGYACPTEQLALLCGPNNNTNIQGVIHVMQTNNNEFPDYNSRPSSQFARLLPISLFGVTNVRSIRLNSKLWFSPALLQLTEQQCSVARRLTNQVGLLYTIRNLRQMMLLYWLIGWLAGMSDQPSTWSDICQIILKKL